MESKEEVIQKLNETTEVVQEAVKLKLGEPVANPTEIQEVLDSSFNPPMEIHVNPFELGVLLREKKKKKERLKMEQTRIKNRKKRKRKNR